MDANQVYTLVILIGVLVLLVTEWVPPGITGLIAIAALSLSPVMDSAEAFAGLTNSAVLAVACMYVISAGVAQTGLAAAAANRIASTGMGPIPTYVSLLALTMLLSGFVNNTPLVLIMIPLVLGLSDRLDEPPSRLLIPLSYLSILGGMCTLIGTSTNLIVNSSLKVTTGGAFELGVFDFARLGVILAVAGGVLVLLLRRRILPERASLGLATRKGVAVEYMTEIVVREGSGLEGKSLAEVQEGKLLGEDLRILEVVRGAVIRVPNPDIALQPGDLLLVKGGPDAVAQLRMREEKESGTGVSSVRGVALTLFEVVVTPGSPWVGRRVEQLRFRESFGVSVFALQRHSAHLRDKIERLRLQVGDVLLVQGSEEALQNMRSSRGALVVEGVDTLVKQTRQAPIAGIALLLFVVVAMTKVLPIELGGLLAALLMVLTRTISVPRAYESIGWDVLFLVAGTLAIGSAFERTGLAAASAEALVDMAEPFGPRAVLACLMLLSTLLTQILSNNATAAFMTPLAWQIGGLVNGASPMACVMAVAFGANCSFLTPVSYNTNLLVYGPGGYRFKDFLIAGLPLTVLFLTLGIALLPLLY